MRTTATETLHEAVSPSPLPSNTTPFTDFNGLHREIMPHYSVRSLRTLVRNGTIPSIVLPNGRKRTFHMPSVIAALRRFQTGGAL